MIRRWTVRLCMHNTCFSVKGKLCNKQESIPVGCVLPTCANCTCFSSHQVSEVVEGPEVNRFEQVSSDGCQMSLVGGVPVQWGHMSRGGLGPGGPCPLRSYVHRRAGAGGWGPVQWGPMHHRYWSHGTPSPLWTDRHDWKHYLPATSLMGCNNGTNAKRKGVCDSR